MKKINGLNFKAMSKLNVMEDFCEARIQLAKLAMKHKDRLDVLEANLEIAKKARAAGEADSIVEAQNKLNAENTAYKTACEAPRKVVRDVCGYDKKTGEGPILSKTFKVVKQLRGGKTRTDYVSLYDAYVAYVNEDKRGDFMVVVDSVLVTCGLTDTSAPNSSAVRNMSQIFAARIGVKKAGAQRLVKDNVYTSELGVGQFSELFIGILADILNTNGVTLPKADSVDCPVYGTDPVKAGEEQDEKASEDKKKESEDKKKVSEDKKKVTAA